MTKVKLKCSNCGKEFERSKSEAARNEKIGRRVYCSLECNGHSGHAHLAPYKGVRSPNFIRCNDGLSSMRFHLKIIRWHCKKKGWIPERWTSSDHAAKWASALCRLGIAQRSLNSALSRSDIKATSQT